MTVPPDIEAIIELALQEDVGPGDWTTLWTVPADRQVRARIIAKAEGVIAGTAGAVAAFRRVDPELDVQVHAADGTLVTPGQEVMALQGRARAILTGERVALNLLQRLSGVATLTRRFADALAGTRTRVLDTRKTTPGMRRLEKDAVAAGGGMNHRFGLHDMVLIKENHIRAAGGIEAAVRAVGQHNAAGLPVEVEVTSIAELRKALEVGVDRVMLDNMGLEEMREAVRLVRALSPAMETEASGNVTLASVRAIAETGVDFVSVGALTHSAPALDLSLLVDDLV